VVRSCPRVGKSKIVAAVRFEGNVNGWLGVVWNKPRSGVFSSEFNAL
jgi:hypothetical protein